MSAESRSAHPADRGGSTEPPTVVVVGAASRDVTDENSRGWRLGGGVTYGALATAGLGLATAALVGVDAPAARAPELDLLRQAGVDVRLVPLATGPVFRNIERPEGRLQVALALSDEVPVESLPDGWRRAPAWILAPVAAELGEAWAAVPSPSAYVAVGWQGLLRDLHAGEPVGRRPPSPSALLARADLVGISRDDVAPDTELATLTALLRRGATLAITQGDQGGLLVTAGGGSEPRVRHYPAVRCHRPIDPTGAGDVFLATLAAARVELTLAGETLTHGVDVLLAAAAASLVIEAPGLTGVGDRAAVRRRMLEAGGRAPPRADRPRPARPARPGRPGSERTERATRRRRAPR